MEGGNANVGCAPVIRRSYPQIRMSIPSRDDIVHPCHIPAGARWIRKIPSWSTGCLEATGIQHQVDSDGPNGGGDCKTPWLSRPQLNYVLWN